MDINEIIGDAETYMKRFEKVETKKRDWEFILAMSLVTISLIAIAVTVFLHFFVVPHLGV